MKKLEGKVRNTIDNVCHEARQSKKVKLKVTKSFLLSYFMCVSLSFILGLQCAIFKRLAVEIN